MTSKPHKFFKRELDNDLTELSTFLRGAYKSIESAELRGVEPMGETEYFLESKSASTIKWRQYNVFQFYNPAIYKLFQSVSDMVKEACEYYDVDFDSQFFMVQGWFNITQSGKGKLDWHDHGKGHSPHFHGYYAVNAEPSITHYKIYGDDNNIVDNINKNNVAILSEVGHPHAMGDWDWQGDRITIAYDVAPVSILNTGDPDKVVQQHWIPLI